MLAGLLSGPDVLVPFVITGVLQRGRTVSSEAMAPGLAAAQDGGEDGVRRRPAPCPGSDPVPPWPCDAQGHPLLTGVVPAAELCPPFLLLVCVPGSLPELGL